MSYLPTLVPCPCPQDKGRLVTPAVVRHHLLLHALSPNDLDAPLEPDEGQAQQTAFQGIANQILQGPAPQFVFSWGTEVSSLSKELDAHAPSNALFLHAEALYLSLDPPPPSVLQSLWGKIQELKEVHRLKQESLLHCESLTFLPHIARGSYSPSTRKPQGEKRRLVEGHCDGPYPGLAGDDHERRVQLPIEVSQLPFSLFSER